MIRRYIDWLNRSLTWLKRSRQIRPSDGSVKVNAGSSLVVTSGWINVDGSPHTLFAHWPAPVLRLLYKISNAREWCGDPEYYIRQLRSHVFVHHNIEYGLPFVDESVDFVYCSHVLEHFYPTIAKRFVRDAYRVLKSGGMFRVCVPDLQHACALYAGGQKQQALSYFFEPRSGEFNRHRYMYDADMLTDLLREAGFRFVVRCMYRQGSVPDLQVLDNRPEETLYVECAKP